MSERKSLRILVFDAGDARCISQLHILNEFMYRLKQRTGKIVRPCDYFHLMVGVDGSGLVVALLGLLGMNPLEAEEAFFDVYDTVFADTGATRETRTLRLNTALKRLLKSRNLSESVRISDSSLDHGCKVALCYVSASDMNSCNMFRNYPSEQLHRDVTFVEAIQATWTTPTLISPILIGPRSGEAFSAVLGFGNPMLEAIREAHRVFGVQARVSILLNLGSGHRGVISAINKRTWVDVGDQAIRDCEVIAEDIQRRLGNFGIYYRLSVDHGLDRWTLDHDGIGAIISHVETYLSRTDPSNKLNQCISASQRVSTVSLERIYRSKAHKTRSRHGLPPLSAYFTMRKKPMETMIRCLLESSDLIQRIMVISGLGGGGKTQLALKFAHDFEESYRHILFIDASSAESIRKGIVGCVRSMSTEDITTVQEALDFLQTGDDEVTRDWFIIFDNADDPDVDISSFFPQCDHGSILVTTRDPSIENLAPESSLRLDAMDPNEATEALLSCVFPVGDVTSRATPHDREAAAVIVEELGFLPIAVVQSGCYIRQHRVLHQYLERLRNGRADILKHATRMQRDKLKYPHSVYASFDITLSALSVRAVQLLSLLSFFHFSNFPRLLLAVAAKSKFTHELYDLLDRPPEFETSVLFLNKLLCSTGALKDFDIDNLLEELQRYSLVIPVPVQSMTTFRFHPLVLSWARDRMTTEEYSFYQAAAIRLLVCGITIGDDLYLSEYLSSHITELDSIFDSLHVNDRAAISVILRAERKHDRFRTIWNRIHHEVEAVHGENHIRTNRVALEIAAIALYPVTNENCEKAKTMMEGVVISREKILGNDHLENAEARLALSCILCECRQRERAAELQKCILRDQIKTLGLCHLDTANTLMELSTTTLLLPTYRSTRQHIIIAAASIRTKLLGRSAQRTILSLQDLASCHALLHHYAESESLRTEIQELQQTIHPDQHLADVGSMAILASLYDTQGWYKEAEQLRRWELETRRHLQGERNSQTLMTMSWLGHALFQQKRYEEAEQVYAESLERRRQLHGVHHLATLNAMSWSARTLYAQSRYAEAERLWKEQWGIFQVLLGNKHKSTLVSMNSVAKAYVKQGKYTEAEALLTEELELRRELHGNGHPETFDSIHWLGQTLFSQGRYEDAEKLWKEEVEGRQSQGSSGEVELTARVHHHLALLYRQTRRYEEAKEAAEQAVRIREPLGSDEAALLESSQLLASIKEHITTTHPQTSSQSALEEKTAPIQAASVTHHKRPIQAAADGGTSSDGDDISAPEADEDMRSVHQSETAGPVASGSARPIRPFTMRELFGGRPNAWSMF